MLLFPCAQTAETMGNIIGLQGDYLSVGAGVYLDVTENGWSFTGGYSYGGGGSK